MKNIALLLLLLLVVPAFSQEDVNGFDMTESFEDVKPKHSYSIDIGLPVGTSNKAFQSWMDGLLNISTHYYYSLPSNFSIGAGIRYTYFRVNQFRVPEPAHGGVHGVSTFLRLGYEKFHTTRFGTDVALKVGYEQMNYTTDALRELGKKMNFGTMFIEPSFSLILTASEFTSYRLNIAYAVQGYAFNNDRVGINSKGGYGGADFKSATQFISFGFGFTYYFKQHI